MSTLFTDEFTAANGTTLPDAGYERVYPPASTSITEAVVQANKGYGASVAREKIYRSTSYPGLVNYNGQLTLFWASPTSHGRAMGVGVRVDATGKGYYLQVDSNTGVARARLRYFDGVSAWTNLGGGWTDVSATATPSALTAGLALRLKVKNEDGGVRLIGKINGVTFFDYLDVLNLLTDGGTLALWIDGLTTSAQITWDDLTALDFEDEATGDVSSSTSGIVVVVDGEYFEELEWSSRGILPLTAEDSYDVRPAGSIADLEKFNEPALSSGADIALLYNGVWLSRGIIRGVTSSLRASEGTVYEITSPKQIALEIPLEDSRTGAGAINYNTTAQDLIEKDPAKQDMSIGDMIADVLTTHAGGDGGLRALGAAPPSGDIFTAAELAVLDAKPINVQVSGSVMSAVETLLGYMPEYGCRINPQTLAWEFHKRSTAAYKTVDLATSHVTGELRENLDANFTAILVRGTRVEAPMTTLKLSRGELEAPAHHAALKSTYNAEKSWKNYDQTTISGSGVNGDGRAYIDLVTGANFSMEANEWKAVQAVIAPPSPATGSYDVYSNTTTRVVFDRMGWGAVPQPNVGDAVALVGGANGRDNAFNELFRTFELPDPYGLRNGSCVTATIKTKNASGGYNLVKTKATVNNPGAGKPTTIKLDIPALQPIGLVNYPTADACDEGTSFIADDVEIEAPVMPDKDDPAIPTLRVPAAGFRGTAFSFDPLKWDGGGQPGKGDKRLRKVMTLDDPGFSGGAEVGDYTKLCNALLAVLGTLARQARLSLADTLDTSWSGLNKRVRLFATGRRTTGYETATDMWQVGVIYDLLHKKTEVYVGTLSSLGKFDIGKTRQLYAERTKFDMLREQAAAAQSFLDCLAASIAGGGTASQGNPNALCASSISVGGGGSVADRLGGSCSTVVINMVAACAPCCGTFSAGQMTSLINNLAKMGSQTVTGDNVVDKLCCTMEVLNYTGKWFGSWAHAVDAALCAGGVDMGNIYLDLLQHATAINANATALLNLQACVNLNWTLITACFRNKYDFPGSGCTLDPCAVSTTPATVGFSPTLCDPVCEMDPPVPDPCT